MKPDWIDVPTAYERILSSIAPLEPEYVPLEAARGRVLAEDVESPVDLPLWTNSGMDGFAVRAEDVRSASDSSPVVLPVTDEVPAGSFPREPLRPGTAVRVMTGAPVPEGADSVVRVEHTDGSSLTPAGDRVVTIFSAQDAGRNLRRRGEDVRRGDVALPAGLELGPAGIGVAASLGQRHLRVIRRPRVAVLTSGDELVELEDFDQVLAGRKIVSSNSYTLAAQLAELGCEMRYLGIAPDSASALRSALERAADSDVLVTSAGISVGEHDLVRRVLLDLQVEVAFWRVRIRPGSPLAFGRVGGLGGIPWFGLPGNPVSSMVTFEMFVRPALLKMSGHRRLFRRTLQATLLDEPPAAPGLTQFVRVRLEQRNGGLAARLTGAQGSGILSSVAAADGLMVIPEGSSQTSGGSFAVVPFGPGLLSDAPGF